MKKYIPLLVVTSLLLSACSIGGGDKDNLFQKKQECEQYKDKAMEIYKSITGGYIEHANLEEIFYSSNGNSCYSIISSYSLGIDEETKTPTKRVQQLELFDILNHKKIARKMNCKELNNCTDKGESEDSNYLKQIKFLKGE